jgi:haloalkane dehalogenase
MHQIFVELYNYNDGWRQETPEKRMAFVLEISKAINSLADHGIEVIAYCFNDQETDRRAPFDFFCVYRVPSIEAQRIFEQQIAASDWYRYFDQVNLRGAAMSPTGVLLANVALAPAIPQSEPISSAMPYAKHYAKAFDRQMAYIEAGHGDPIVFLHGDVMSSYLWRNVIPHVESLGRCIAIDLIGAGDSDKLPGSGPGSYNFAEHSRYLDALLEELRIDGNVVFVGHDWGANLAIDWAARHETKVKGIAFSEPLVPPFEWSDWPQYVTPLFDLLRSDAAEKAVLDHNMFVRASAAGGNLRMLAPEERAEIERPYAEAGEARRPTLTWPREVPFEQDHTPTRVSVEAHAAWLTKTQMPKLYLRGVPGAMLFGRKEATVRQFPNLSEVSVKGLHWAPEDDPHAIGRALYDWIGKIRA